MQMCNYAVLGVLVFSPRKFLDFLTFLAKILAITLGHVGKICMIFQDRGKKSKRILEAVDRKTKNIQGFGKKKKENLASK